MKKYFFVYLILILISPHDAYNQHVGRYDTTIVFNKENRVLSFFTPLDYNKTKEHVLMVGLHGAGDHSKNYCNFMQSISTCNNSIIVCPDGGTDSIFDGKKWLPAGSFHAPKGDEEIINIAISISKNLYTINNSGIYLCGFSLGGRSALKFGLDNHDLFKGLLLFTPGLLYIDEVRNLWDIKFNYSNASYIPISISVGTSDNYWYPIVNEIVDSLKSHSGAINFFKMNNRGHEPPKLSEMCDQLNYLQNANVTSIEIITRGNIQIFPNPMTASENLKINSSILIRNIFIRDELGRLINSYNKVNTYKFELCKDEKASGIYFYNIELENADFISGKLLVE